MIIRDRMTQAPAPQDLYAQARQGLEQAFANVDRYDPASQARMYAMANYLNSIRPDQFDPNAAMQVQQAASRPAPMVTRQANWAGPANVPPENQFERQARAVWERAPRQQQPVQQPAQQPQPAQVQPTNQGIIAGVRQWTEQDRAVMQHHAEVERMRQFVAQAQQAQRRERERTQQSYKGNLPPASATASQPNAGFRPFPQQQAAANPLQPQRQPSQQQGNPYPVNPWPAY